VIHEAPLTTHVKVTQKEMIVIQQTTARNKCEPRSVADLEVELARCDSVLLQAQRAKNAARTSIPALMVAGDNAAIDACRDEIATLDSHIATFTERREQTHDAIQAAKRRDQAKYAAEEYQHLRKQLADFKTANFRLDASINVFAEAFMQVRAQLAALEAAMVNAGCTPDPYAFRVKFAAMLQMGLWLATDGVLGENRTMDTPKQLRESRRADLKAAAVEAYELYMRQVRAKLGVDNHPNEAA